MAGTVDGPMNSCGSYPQAEMSSAGSGAINTESGPISIEQTNRQEPDSQCADKFLDAFIDGVVCGIGIVEAPPSFGLSLIPTAKDCIDFTTSAAEAVSACTPPPSDGIDSADGWVFEGP